MTSPPVVPLESIAPDAVALIAAFREAGGASFGSAPVAEARKAYLASCRANGPSLESVGSVATMDCPVDGGRIGLRHYAPTAEQGRAGSPSPVILFLHGGGWAIGDLDSHDLICRFLVARSGLPLLAVDYRLAPEHRFPVPLEDCMAALRFVGENAQALGVDTRRIVLVGDSAGGALAAVLANNPLFAVEGLGIAGQVLLYPVTDLAAESGSYERIQEGFPLTADSMRWFAGLYLEPGADPADPRVSPLRLERPVPAPPPAFLVTLGLDPLADEGVAYAGHLARHGAHVEHHHLPRHAHGIFTSAGKIDTGRRILERAAAFIREVAP